MDPGKGWATWGQAEYTPSYAVLVYSGENQTDLLQWPFGKWPPFGSL